MQGATSDFPSARKGRRRPGATLRHTRSGALRWLRGASPRAHDEALKKSGQTPISRQKRRFPRALNWGRLNHIGRGTDPPFVHHDGLSDKHIIALHGL